MQATEYTPRPLYQFDFSDFEWYQGSDPHVRGRLGRVPSWQVGLSYPSPPMSGPPSPKRICLEKPMTKSPSNVVVPPVTASGLAAGVPASSSSGHPPAEHTSSPQPPTSEATMTIRPRTPTASLIPHSQSSARAETPEPTTDQPVNSSPSRGGRRSKAHVANACGNCKRAHLSCDVQRPCVRCVATSKAVCHSMNHEILRM